MYLLLQAPAPHSEVPRLDASLVCGHSHVVCLALLLFLSAVALKLWNLEALSSLESSELYWLGGECVGERVHLRECHLVLPESQKGASDAPVQMMALGKGTAVSQGSEDSLTSQYY